MLMYRKFGLLVKAFLFSCDSSTTAQVGLGIPTYPQLLDFVLDWIDKSVC